MVKPVFLAVLFISFIFFPGPGEAKIVEEHIWLVPSGNIDKEALKEIKDELPGSLPMSAKVVLEAQKDIPPAAYDPSRKQYNAETVLDGISRLTTVDTRNERTLIVVDVDLYARELNFVFGLANAKKGICIISLARLRNEFYGLKPDRKLFIERAVKEAVHELGHSWGLAHCPNPKCVMSFSNSLSDTDRKRQTFCRDCRNKLRRRYESPLFNTSGIFQDFLV